MARIFISYSRSDADFARRVAQSLSDHGEDIWIDVEDIPAGMNWSSAIQQGLHICDVMLVILSPDSVASSNVADEWQDYHDRRKPIIPILWKPVPPSDIHFQLRRIQYIDFHTQDYDKALTQLHAAILNRHAPATPHTPVSSPPSPKERRLEAAMPQQTQAATPTEVWVKVTLTGSPGLRAELPAAVASGDVIQKGDVRGSTFPIAFPTEDGRLLPVNVCVKVRSEAFRVRAEADDSGACDEGEVALQLHPDHDSRTVVFELHPAPGQALGRARITVSLFLDGTLVGQTAVSTDIVATVASALPWNLLAMPLILGAMQGAYVPGDTTLTATPTIPLPPSAMPRPQARRGGLSPTLISGATLVALVVLGGVMFSRWATAPVADSRATETGQAIIVGTNMDTHPTQTPLATATAVATLTAREHYEQARTYRNEGNYTAAIAAYTQAIALDAGYRDAYTNRGVSYMDVQDYERAAADFYRALELDPAYPNAHRGLGDALYAQQRYDEALASYQRYLELETESPDETVIDRVAELEARLTATPPP